MPRLITLDLGSHSVKVATWRLAGRGQLELEQRYDRAVPQESVSAPPPEPVEGSDAPAPVAIATPPTLAHRLAALDALLEEVPTLKPASADLVLLAWPSNEAAFHRLTVPFSDRNQIERTLPFTIENEVPFDLGNMVLSWRLAESINGKNDVLVALARKERVAEWLSALEERGIDPAAVHVDADVLGPWGGVPRALSDDGPEDARPAPLVAVVDVGHVHTTVSVVRNGAVQIARSVNVGGWAFTRAISDAMQVPFGEAERLKHGSGLEADEAPTEGASPSAYQRLPAAAREKVDGAIGLLLAEIRSTLIKAEDQLGAEVSELRITGGGSLVAELRDYLETDLGVPVVEALDPRGIAGPPGFALVQALASAYGTTSFLDLRVGDLAYGGRTDRLRAALGYGFSGSVFFSFAALLMFAWQYHGLSVEQTQAEEQVRAIVARSFPEVPADTFASMDKAEAVMAQFTQDAVDRAQVLGDGGGIPPTIDTLYALTKAFPPHPDTKVEVSELTITQSTITFNAETDAYKASSEVEERLKADPRFHTATKGVEQKLANNHVRFPITISLEATTDAKPGSPKDGG